ncbi:hypothetical protein C8Q73DRAFT_192507 [Cubamyces lactineus]|nr:hypothetical protein C8Q73DRAFT_192507 [Cubamyces lactineus]
MEALDTPSPSISPMKIPHPTPSPELDILAGRDDAPEAPLLLTLTLTVTLPPGATSSAVPTFSSASDRSRDAVPTPVPSNTFPFTPIAETSTVVTQAASSSMSMSDASTVAAVTGAVVVLSIVTFSLVAYVLHRAHGRQVEGKHAHSTSDSPNSSRSESAEARISRKRSLVDDYPDSVIHISPGGPFAAPYHARSSSKISIPLTVQPIGSETVGEKIRVSPT